MNASLQNNILYEQLLLESFLDSIKNFAKDKLNKAITTISNWKDAAVVFARILSSEKLLDDFLPPLQRRFEQKLESLYDSLRKLKLDSLIDVVEALKNKINSLSGWKKLLALVAGGSIPLFIIKNLKRFSTQQLTKFINNNLSVNFFKDLVGNLTSWSSFIGVLQPIVDGVDSIYEFLKELLSKFSDALQSGKQMATKIIKEEVQRMQKLAGIK